MTPGRDDNGRSPSVHASSTSGPPPSAVRKRPATSRRRPGRLLVRERLALLLDGEPDFEDGLLARTEEGLAGDAVVTVIGQVDGRPVAVIANDFTVKAGTWGRRTYEKITHLQERADALGIPVVYLVDAAGARIDEQFDSYAGRHAWGNIFTNLVRFSGRVPQVCALFGPSPAGSAYVPALCDVVIMVRGHATAYIGSPRLAEMVIGERVTLEEMGGAEMHCRQSGLGDVLVDDDAEAIAAVRVWLSYLPSSWREEPPATTACPAAPPARPLEEIVPDPGGRPLRRQRAHRGRRRRGDLLPLQGPLRPGAGVRLRPARGPAGRRAGQPVAAQGRGAVLRQLRQGGPLHLDL